MPPKPPKPSEEEVLPPPCVGGRRERSERAERQDWGFYHLEESSYFFSGPFDGCSSSQRQRGEDGMRWAALLLQGPNEPCKTIEKKRRRRRFLFHSQLKNRLNSFILLRLLSHPSLAIYVFIFFPSVKLALISFGIGFDETFFFFVWARFFIVKATKLLVVSIDPDGLFV